jgi:hypothetical protein
MAAAVGIALDRDTWYKASDQELTRLILRAADGCFAALAPWDDPEKIRALEILAILAADVLYDKLNFSRQAFFMGDTNPSEVPRRFVGPDGLEPLEPEAPAAVPPSLTPTRRKYR